jgi:hypothetical protein
MSDMRRLCWIGRILSHLVRFNPKWCLYYQFGSTKDAIAFVDRLYPISWPTFKAEEHVIPLSEYKASRFNILDNRRIEDVYKETAKE